MVSINLEKKKYDLNDDGLSVKCTAQKCVKLCVVVVLRKDSSVSVCTFSFCFSFLVSVFTFCNAVQQLMPANVCFSVQYKLFVHS